MKRIEIHMTTWNYRYCRDSCKGIKLQHVLPTLTCTRLREIATCESKHGGTVSTDRSNPESLPLDWRDGNRYNIIKQLVCMYKPIQSNITSGYFQLSYKGAWEENIFQLSKISTIIQGEIHHSQQSEISTLTGTRKEQSWRRQTENVLSIISSDMYLELDQSFPSPGPSLVLATNSELLHGGTLFKPGKILIKSTYCF